PKAVRERVQAASGLTHVVVLPSQAQLLREAARVGPPMVLSAPRASTSNIIMRLAREVAGLRVGLALGAGAAKGLAHIGVVGGLERLSMPIDVVTGTSIGALVGAALAMGMDVRQISDTLDRLLDLWVAALKPVLPRASLMS